MNVQAICDSQNKFLDVVARWPGSSHDSHIFRNSYIYNRFENGEFGDGLLLGDSGYPLKDYLMTPLANPQTPAEELYNRAHISTRTVIERTFGIWKRRFPILSCGMRCSIPLSQQIVIATAVLHNIATEQRDHENMEYLAEEDIPEVNQENGVFNVAQRRLIDYFQGLL